MARVNQQFIERARKADFTKPTFLAPVTDPKDPRIAQAYAYYNSKFALEKGVSFVHRYMESSSFTKNDIDYIKSLSPWQMGPVACWIAALILEDVTLPQEQQNWLRGRIDNALLSRPEVVVSKTTEKKPTVQDHFAKQAWEFIPDFDQWVDAQYNAKKPLKFDIIGYLTENKVSNQVVRHIIRYYSTDLKEKIDAIECLDEDVLEHYLPYPPDKLLRQAKFLKSIIDDCEAYCVQVRADAPVVPRKPRKKREKKPSNLVKKVKYKVSFPELGLTSLTPTEIIDAQAVWLYNTKYKILTVLRSDKGLSVKGTTVIGFNKESQSRALRKPKETLTKLMNGGKLIQRGLLDSLTTKDKKCTGRINSDMIILKVIK